MSSGPILTLGLGSFGSVNLLPTLGYSSGEAPVIPTFYGVLGIGEVTVLIPESIATALIPEANLTMTDTES